jgi:LruC domain-containing protein
MIKKTLLLLSVAYSNCIADFSSTSDIEWHYQFKNYSDVGGILEEDKATPLYEINSSMLNTMLTSLPEYHNASLEHPEYFPSPEPEIVLANTAEVFVTFYSEGASYRNSLGYYTYDGDTNRSAPTSIEDVKDNGIILYPNSSLLNSGGDLSLGTSVSLGTLTKDTKVMFFLVANGWQGSTTGVQSSNDWIFSTLSNLNKEYNANSQKTVPDHKHVALLWKDTGPGNILLMGFEDILRTNIACDHDFNDALFSISSSPLNALKDSTKVKTGKSGFAKALEDLDRDKDGVNDALDEYPEDSKRAYNQYYPSNEGNATLIFEDMWPSEGDYDMNDLSILFSIKEIKNAEQKVKDIVFSGSIQAYGGSYTNGFGLLVDTPLSNIASAHMSINKGKKSDITANLRADANETYIKLFTDAIIYDLDHFGNVYKDDTFVQSDTFELYLTFNDATILTAPPYNPFMIVTRNILEDGEHILRDNIEVHLPDYAASSFAEQSLFGTGVDTHKIKYTTRDNKPWALLIPSTFAHPIEQVNIKKAYNYFSDWVKSAGSTKADWYLHDKRDAQNQLYANEKNIILRP